MKLQRYQESRTAFILLTVLLKLAYDLSYVYLVSPLFSWTEAYYPLSVHAGKLAESYAIALILASTMPHRVKCPSDFLVVFLGAGVILPMLSLYALADRNRAFTYIVILTYLIILVTVLVFPRLRMRIRVLKQGPTTALIACGMGALVTVAFLLHNVGLELFNLRFWDYPQMVANRWVIQTRLTETGFLAYLYFWLFIVFIPVLIMWAVVQKRYVAFWMLILFQVVLTGLTARRHTLLIIPVLLGTYVIAEKRRLAPILILSAFLTLVAVSTLMSIFTDFILIGTWMTRYFFSPARANYAYYEFFSKAGFVYMSNTKLPVPISYPFEDIPARLVGHNVLLNPETVASAGFIATSYMHFGFVGLVMFGVIVGLLFRLADRLCVGRMPLRLGMPLTVVIFSGLLKGADLTTWLLTFGGFIGFIMLWLLGGEKRK